MERNLWQRIADVMQDIKYLQKDDKVGFGNNSYKAISEEKVTESLRVSLIKNGLVILPVEQQHFREDTITKDETGKEKLNRLSTVNTKYKIVNIDNPTEFEILVSSGTGVDTQDKGVGKAMTYSYKYMLLRTFAIPTGEDTDKISSAELDEQQGKTPVNIPVNLQANDLITEGQGKRLFAIAKGKTKQAKEIMQKYGYTESKFIKKTDYEKIIAEIEKVAV